MTSLKHTPTVFLKYGGLLMALLGTASMFNFANPILRRGSLDSTLYITLGFIMLICGLTLTAKMQRVMVAAISIILLLRCIIAGLYALATGSSTEPLMDLGLTILISAWGLSTALRRPEPVIATTDAVENR